MADRKIRFGLWYDFRNPPEWRRPYPQLYGEILDQIAWAEDKGFDDVWLSEHHFSEDGYSPSLLPIAAAIAARTKRIRIGTNVVLLPLYHPVRLAEDAATVDVISAGRFELGVAAGWRVEEFEGFGVSIKERGGRTNEGLEILRRLLEGESLTYKGKYYEVKNVRISPEPVQKPRPPIWVGGYTPPAIRRAAKYADGYSGRGPLKSAYTQYVRALEKLGKPTDHLRLAGGMDWLIPAKDPEKTWNEAADHIIYHVNSYVEWAEKSGTATRFTHTRDKAHLRELGTLKVVDVDACIQIIRDYASDVPLTHFCFWALPPGLPPKWMQPHLELMAREVIPKFR